MDVLEGVRTPPHSLHRLEVHVGALDCIDLRLQGHSCACNPVQFVLVRFLLTQRCLGGCIIRASNVISVILDQMRMRGRTSSHSAKRRRAHGQHFLASSAELWSLLCNAAASRGVLPPGGSADVNFLCDESPNEVVIPTGARTKLAAHHQVAPLTLAA